MDKQQIVFREYTKDIIPDYNDYGVVIHSISASCKDPARAVIEHSFGHEEGLNEFIKLGKIADAHNLHLNKTQPRTNSEYSFMIHNCNTPKKPILIDDKKQKANAKTFQIFWRESFGIGKRAMYCWGWMSRVMFSPCSFKAEQSSSLKLGYPTGKLKLRLFLPKLFPLDENPCLEMQNSKGQKARLGITNKVDATKEHINFDLKNKLDVKCYKIEIYRPNIEETYKIIWTLGSKELPRYLAWLESKY